MKCLECGKDFESLKSLHHHVKAHETCLGDYYVKHFNKKDLFNGQQIPFKNYNQYIDTDFLNYDNYRSWIKLAPQEKSKEYILDRANKKFGDKTVGFSPPDTYYKMSGMADISIIKDLFKSYSFFLSELNKKYSLDIKPWFNKKLPEGFWDLEPNIPILIDSREQLPLEFENSIKQKLDFGDYTTNEKYYSKTFIDRKSESDFLGTFGAGSDRFRREMDRCVKFNSYMFVVVESNIDKIKDNPRNRKINMEYVWHNSRSLMLEYPNNLQIIFAQNRSGIKKLVPKILFYGKELWNVDLQYFIEERIKHVG